MEKFENNEKSQRLHTGNKFVSKCSSNSRYGYSKLYDTLPVRLHREFCLDWSVSSLYYDQKITKFKHLQIPVTYPTTAPEIALPELDGKTAKMYRYVSCLNMKIILKYWKTGLKRKSTTLIFVTSAKIRPFSHAFLYFRGGKICMTDHFKPLWARNVPKFGIGHAMALGVS